MWHDGKPTKKFNAYLFACKLFICFLPALALLLCAFEYWIALALTILLSAAASHEIRKGGTNNP